MTDKDLTAPEAVERLAKSLAFVANRTGMTVEKCEQVADQAAATLRALSAQLLDVSKRESAMVLRYDAKLEAAEAERDVIKAELASVVEAKLKVAVELLKQAQPLIDPCYPSADRDWQHNTRAFLATLDQST